MKKITVGLVAIGVKILPKFITILGKLGKLFKVGKVALFGASFAAYTHLFTWQFACLILFSIFFHESGHIWAMKKCGIKTKGIYFIPFMGAAAVSEDMWASRENEAFIALMGPVWGFALALATAGVWFMTNEPIFAAAAGWMCAINLFNLLPVVPLDGGRVVNAIAFSLHSWIGYIFLVLSFVGLGTFAIYTSFGLFFFLLIVGGVDTLFAVIIPFLKQRRLKNAETELKMYFQGRDQDRVKIITSFMANVLNNTDPYETDFQFLANVAKTHLVELERSSSDLPTAEEFLYIVTAIKIANEKAKIESTTPTTLSWKGVTITAVVSVSLLLGLWTLGDYVKHVPGADIAMEFLKDSDDTKSDSEQTQEKPH